MYILFQVKRFLSIYWKEFFLPVIKKSKKKTLIKKPEFKEYGVPNLNKEIEIKLDNFSTLQQKNEHPIYNKSILFLIIEKHKDDILDNLISIISVIYSFKIKIGIEIEFYINNNVKNIDIIHELKKIIKNTDGVEKERGQNQFEIKTKPYTDLKKLVSDYQFILENINNFCSSNNLKLSFDALPFDNDCGSALQINLSLINSNQKNLFSRTKIDNDMIEGDLMLNCIGGLLNNINKNLLLYIKNEECLKRFNLEQNIKIKKLNKFPAPTFISWGINNRTASIRIPTPTVKDFSKYIEEDNENRRIEFRVPSASADLKLIIIGVLSSIIDGLENDLKPHIEKSSFDITTTNDNLEKIETNISNLNNIFKINENVLFFNIPSAK
jgi:glutamine synthetase